MIAVRTLTRQSDENRLRKWLSENHISYNYKCDLLPSSYDIWSFYKEEDALLFSLVWGEFVIK